MTQFRILTYFVPRLSQLLGWSFDTNASLEPFLKQENLSKQKDKILPNIQKLQQNLYQPPPYIPSNLSKGRS